MCFGIIATAIRSVFFCPTAARVVSHDMNDKAALKVDGTSAARGNRGQEPIAGLGIVGVVVSGWLARG